MKFDENKTANSILIGLTIITLCAMTMTFLAVHKKNIEWKEIHSEQASDTNN